MKHEPRDEDYRRLLAFRVELRDFLRWSEDTAKSAGLTGALHQLLLVVRGEREPTIAQAAARLHIRHHSAVELVARAQEAGLVRRVSDEGDHRLVRLALTAEGDVRLQALTIEHLPRIAGLAARLEAVLGAGFAAPPVRRSRSRRHP